MVRQDIFSQQLMGKRILITGATGFIGSNIVRYFLNSGAKVFIFTRKTSNKWRINDILNDISEYQVDLLDKEKLNTALREIKPEIIIHTAIYGGFTFQKNENDIFKTNLFGTTNLVNACANLGFELFINTGSSSEYGIKDKPMKESDLLEPINIYGVSKSAATLFCREKAKIEKLPIVTLRLFSPYGYYEAKTRLISSVIISCLSGLNPKVSSPKPVRDFVFIKDVISAYISVIQQKDSVRGEIFNIGSGIQYSVGEVISEVIQLTESKVSPEWGSASNPRIEPEIWQADISKANSVLGWQPKYSFEQGLSKTIEWFKENIGEYYDKRK